MNIFKFFQKEPIKILFTPFVVIATLYVFGLLLFATYPFVYAHPVVAGVIVIVIPLVLAILSGYLAGISLCQVLREKHSRVFSYTTSILWYTFWSVSFFFLWSGSTAASLMSAGFKDSDLMRVDYAADPYFIPLSVLFFLTGIVALFFNKRNTQLIEGYPYRKIILRSVRTPIFIFIIGMITLGFFRVPAVNNQEKTQEVVAKIHATKLTLDDVMGKNLPPDPGVEANKTVQGIDANKNGIRDDVELAIFKEYPNSAKTRAVLLQYALALQMEVMQPIVNKETVTAVAEGESRGNYCVTYVTSRDDMTNFIKVDDKLHHFVEDRQINNEKRKKTQHDFYQGNLGSYSTVLAEACDLDISKL